MCEVTNKTRDRLIFSAIIFVLMVVIITAIWHISADLLQIILSILAGLKLGDFIVSVAEWLVDWLNETW